MLQIICIPFVFSHWKENNKSLCKKLNFFKILYHEDPKQSNFCHDFSLVTLYSHLSVKELGAVFRVAPLHGLLHHWPFSLSTVAHKGLMERLRSIFITWVIKEVIKKTTAGRETVWITLRKDFYLFAFFLWKQIWQESMINLTFTQHCNEGRPLLI